MRTLLVLASCAIFALSVSADPPWENEYTKEGKILIKSPRWFDKESGTWLFTCRLEVISTRLVKPVAYLHFEGKDSKEEVVWETKKTVRRKDFEEGSGNRKSRFTRVFLKDVSPEVKKLLVTFKNEPPAKKAEQ